MTAKTYTHADLQAAVAAAMEEAVAICQRVAEGYAKVGDHAIAAGILLTAGNLRALITPDMAALIAIEEGK